MASVMVPPPSSSPVFSPSMSPSIFCKNVNLAMPLSSPRSPTPTLPLLFQSQVEAADNKDRELSVLRRKRPASLALPTGFFTGFNVAPPETSRRLEKDEVEAEGDGYGVYSKKGKKRGPSEDRYSAVVGLQGDDKQAFFGVFDGHGGSKAAEFAAKNMDKKIMEHIRRNNSNVEEAVRDGYLTTDAEFMNEDVCGGTCCVTALITEGGLVVSNAGDCRAVMSRGGVAEALTSDHKPSVESERLRMEDSGGFVDCHRGVWRIQGTLAVSRSIGDKHMKTWVIAEPDTKILRITSGCEFLILASDGLWDKVANQEAVDLVRPLFVGVEKPSPFLAAKRLAELAIRRGSLDDTTVMIIRLDHFIS